MIEGATTLTDSQRARDLELSCEWKGATTAVRRDEAVRLARLNVPYDRIAVIVGWKDASRVAAEMSVARRNKIDVPYRQRELVDKPKPNRDAVKFVKFADLDFGALEQRALAHLFDPAKKLAEITIPRKVWMELYRRARTSGAMVSVDKAGDTGFDVRLKFDRGE